jgi:hypothetical protein
MPFPPASEALQSLLKDCFAQFPNSWTFVFAGMAVFDYHCCVEVLHCMSDRYCCQKPALARRRAFSIKAAALDVLFVVQSSLNGFVKRARRKIGLNASIDGVRVLVKPHAQFLQLLRRERTDSAFDFLDRV